jgi:hypothetical protein
MRWCLRRHARSPAHCLHGLRTKLLADVRCLSLVRRGLEPPPSLHVNLLRRCSQMPEPPQSLRALLWRWRWQTTDGCGTLHPRRLVLASYLRSALLPARNGRPEKCSCRVLKEHSWAAARPASCHLLPQSPALHRCPRRRWRPSGEGRGKTVLGRGAGGAPGRQTAENLVLLTYITCW